MPHPPPAGVISLFSILPPVYRVVWTVADSSIIAAGFLHGTLYFPGISAAP
jgi:hypothetical protein